MFHCFCCLSLGYFLPFSTNLGHFWRFLFNFGVNFGPFSYENPIFSPKSSNFSHFLDKTPSNSAYFRRFRPFSYANIPFLAQIPPISAIFLYKSAILSLKSSNFGDFLSTPPLIRRIFGVFVAPRVQKAANRAFIVRIIIENGQGCQKTGNREACADKTKDIAVFLGGFYSKNGGNCAILGQKWTKSGDFGRNLWKNGQFLRKNGRNRAIGEEIWEKAGNFEGRMGKFEKKSGEIWAISGDRKQFQR
jgi:hypothetical protein